MTSEMQSQPGTQPNRGRNQGVVGAILVAIGLFLLLGQILPFDFGTAIPLGLGLIFLVWGIMVREVGLLIPGGILSGIGVGTLLITGPLSGLTGEGQGGVFLLAFAGGWALITLTATLITRQWVWWPLIPGGILGLIGCAVLAGEPGLRVLEYVGQAWPIFLIGLGLYLVLARRKA